MFELADNGKLQTGTTSCAKIRVVGVGGAGGNAVNTMINAGLTGVEYIAANTDMQALDANFSSMKVQIGKELTKGLGAGANPEIGRKAALEEYEKLSELLSGADMIFITAGMGGGTGTGAAPVIAKLSRELGALTVGVVTRPFLFEGKRRGKQAELGLQSLAEAVDSLITIPNQRLLALAGENLSLIETFKKADDVLLNAVRGISDLINHTGLINADFADVSTVMGKKGLALMGTGVASGADRAVKAANEAIHSPLLEDITIDGATGIIINITGSSSLSTFETNVAVSLVMEAADEEAEIIFGTVIDDSMGDFVKVTVIATGLGNDRFRKKISTTTGVANNKAPINRPVIPSDMQEPFSLNVSEIEITAQQISLADSIRNAASTYDVDLERMSDRESERKISTEESALHGISQPATQKLSQETSVAASEKKLMGIDSNHGSVAQNKNVSKMGRYLEEDERNRAKSIAERLGFINFNEEEFDTPTFLRQEKNSSKSVATDA